MGLQRILVVTGGTIAMLLLMLLRRKSFPQVPLWKYPIISILLTISGVAGAMLMHFIESGSFSGTSFFGAILFIPVFMLPALLLRIPYGQLMDLCAPAECVMLAFMKVDCLFSNCCIGKYLPSLGFQFPSQIVEMVTILGVLAVLLLLERRKKHRNTLYCHYLIMYGVTRFILNWFRYGVAPFALGLPAGNFWSIIAVIFGLVWLLIVTKIQPKKHK